jgi:hypothetical protein
MFLEILFDRLAEIFHVLVKHSPDGGAVFGRNRIFNGSCMNLVLLLGLRHLWNNRSGYQRGAERHECAPSCSWLASHSISSMLPLHQYRVTRPHNAI